MNLLDSGNKLLDDMFMKIYYEIIKSKMKFDPIVFKQEFLQFHEIMADYIDIVPDLELVKEAIEQYGIDKEFVNHLYDQNILFLELKIVENEVKYVFDILLELIEMLPFKIRMEYYRPDKRGNKIGKDIKLIIDRMNQGNINDNLKITRSHQGTIKKINDIITTVDWIFELAKETAYTYNAIEKWYRLCKFYNGFDIEAFKKSTKLQELHSYHNALRFSITL